MSLRAFGHKSRFVVAVVGASAAAGAVPAVSFGWSSSISGGTLTVTGDAGELNNFDIQPGGAAGSVSIFDNNASPSVTAGAAVVPGDGSAEYVGVTKLVVSTGDEDDVLAVDDIGASVTANMGAGNDKAFTAASDDVLSGGAGNDSLDGGNGNNTVNGDGGNDSLFAGSGVDRLNGGDGVDAFSAGAGNDMIDAGSGDDVDMSGDQGDDTISGGGGNDVLAQEPGADKVSGGAGRDEMSYEGAPGGVNVSLNGLADDGSSGEGDNIDSDVEVVRGSGFQDKLVASPVGTVLLGMDGTDVLIGGVGSDLLDGGTGDDLLDGDLGPDILRGGDDNDTVTYQSRRAAVSVTIGSSPNDGQAGESDDVGDDVEIVRGSEFADSLTSSPNGGSVLHGHGGSDRIFLRSGGEYYSVADCGYGTDLVRGRGLDRIERDCEVVYEDRILTRLGVQGHASPHFKIDAMRIKVSSSGVVSWRAYCGAATNERCTGALKFTLHGKVVFRQRVTLGGGRSRSYSGRFTGTAKQLAVLYRTGGAVNAELFAKDAAGKMASTKAHVKVLKGLPKRDFWFVRFLVVFKKSSFVAALAAVAVSGVGATSAQAGTWTSTYDWGASAGFQGWTGTEIQGTLVTGGAPWYTLTAGSSAPGRGLFIAPIGGRVFTNNDPSKATGVASGNFTLTAPGASKFTKAAFSGGSYRFETSSTGDSERLQGHFSLKNGSSSVDDFYWNKIASPDGNGFTIDETNTGLSQSLTGSGDKIQVAGEITCSDANDDGVYECPTVDLGTGSHVFAGKAVLTLNDPDTPLVVASGAGLTGSSIWQRTAGPISLDATATDNSSGIRKFEIKRTYKSKTTVELSQAGDCDMKHVGGGAGALNCTESKTISGFNDGGKGRAGTLSYSVVATDDAGGATTQVFTRRIDGVKPSSGSLSGLGSKTSASSETVAVRAADGLSGVKRVEIIARSSSGKETLVGQVDPSCSSGCPKRLVTSTKLDLSGLGKGTYKMVLRVKDVVGNLSTINSGQLEKLSVRPSRSSSSDRRGRPFREVSGLREYISETTRAIHFKWEATGRSKSSYRFYMDGKFINETAHPSLDICDVTAGLHRWKIIELNVTTRKVLSTATRSFKMPVRSSDGCPGL